MQREKTSTNLGRAELIITLKEKGCPQESLTLETTHQKDILASFTLIINCFLHLIIGQALFPLDGKSNKNYCDTHILNRSENIHFLCYLKGCHSHLRCLFLLVELEVCVLSIAVHQNHVGQLLKMQIGGT